MTSSLSLLRAVAPAVAAMAADARRVSSAMAEHEGRLHGKALDAWRDARCDVTADALVTHADAMMHALAASMRRMEARQPWNDGKV